MNNIGMLRRIWLLMAQVIAIAAGLLIAWRSFGPATGAVPHADVVSLREAAAPAAISASGSAALVNVYTRSASISRRAVTSASKVPRPMRSGNHAS